MLKNLLVNHNNLSIIWSKHNNILLQLSTLLKKKIMFQKFCREVQTCGQEVQTWCLLMQTSSLMNNLGFGKRLDKVSGLTNIVSSLTDMVSRVINRMSNFPYNMSRHKKYMKLRKNHYNIYYSNMLEKHSILHKIWKYNIKFNYKN